MPISGVNAPVPDNSISDAFSRFGSRARLICVTTDALRAFRGGGGAWRIGQGRTPDMAERFPDHRLDKPAATLDLAHQHRALHGRNAKIRQRLRIGSRRSCALSS